MKASLANTIACVAIAAALPALAQQVPPVPIQGGDTIPPLIHQFLPGPGPGFDGLNADPQGITNSRMLVAMAYTAGTATDSAGANYNVGTDIRVYQGEYVAADGTHARGTFVEI
jgi:hypothetical protein